MTQKIDKIEPWCLCCSNEHVISVAHEIIQHAVEKHYGRGKSMCVGSLTDAVTIASHLINAMSAKVLSAHLGLPPGLAEIAGATEQEARRDLVISSFNNLDAPYIIAQLERVDGVFATHTELEKADAAFAAAPKGEEPKAT